MNPWRIGGWTVAVLLLLHPLVAMQFTDEVNWTASDFVFAGILLGVTGLGLELAFRRSRTPTYRAGAALALVAAFLLTWINAAVGIIGSENNDANALYIGVLAIGVVGALVARFRPVGMALALVATAVAQAVVALIAIVGELGLPSTDTAKLLGLNGIFIALYLAAAWLFRKSALERADLA